MGVNTLFDAIYKDKIIYSFDTKNKYGNYEYEIYSEYKEAGQKGLLKCKDCGTLVFLKAGNKKVPHFAHKDSNRFCYSDISINESEEQKRGKFILYKWLKEQYSNVYIDKKYENRRSNVSIENEKCKIVLQYIRKERSINEWNDKRKDYFKNDIKDIYFFSFKEFNPEENTSEEQFRKTVQKYSIDNTIKMLNTDSNELFMMRYMDFKDKDGQLFYSKLFLKKYNIYDVQLTLEGNINCDFEDAYKNAFEEHREIARNLYKKMLTQKRLIEAKKIKENQLRQRLNENWKTANKSYINNEITNKNYNNVEPIKDNKEKLVYRKEELIPNKEKYLNPSGFSYDEIDENFKKIVDTVLDKEWYYKGFRWVKCKRCNRYYVINFCWSFGGLKKEAILGICNNCTVD